ncbi:MAG: hypothetical protein FJ291_00605 [Planctomycetes bacterium]|nr:hypothetical protein [Planctomycetota bacterium]
MVQEKTIEGPVYKVLAELAEVKHAFTIVYEASCNYGNLHDELSKVAWRGHVPEVQAVAAGKETHAA